MKNFLSKNICCIFFALLSLSGLQCFSLAATITPGFPALPDNETTQVIYHSKHSAGQRAQAFLLITRRPETESYHFTSQAHGDYGRYRNVFWTSEITFTIKDGLIYYQSNRGTILRSDKKIVVSGEKIFDYENKQIRFTTRDAAGKMIREKIFPLKGPTVDAALLPYFIRLRLAGEPKNQNKPFYILTEAMNLYHAQIKFFPPEQSNLLDGYESAIKAQVIALSGPLTWMVRTLGPRCLLTFSATAPYELLGFDGLEIDVGSEYITGTAAPARQNR